MSNRRLELSLNPEDGSLQTAPLLHVLLAATDDLHRDLYSAAHGELLVSADEGPQNERLSNLSFAQRRHELAWRLAQHTKGLTHVAALTAHASVTHTPPARTALQHARQAWLQADEAQDALYFFHAQLFPARAAPHDVYGALDVLLRGKWTDLPTDLQLSTSTSTPMQSAAEWKQEWYTLVRRKLLQDDVTHHWKASLQGGVLHLTHESLEAHVTVLFPNVWTLLQLTVTVHPQTGDWSHQLEPSHRQRYDLHRLGARALQQGGLEALFGVAQTFRLAWQLELWSAQAQALRRGVWGATQGPALTITPVQFDHENENGRLAISFWKVDDSYGSPALPNGEKPPVSNQLTLQIKASLQDGVQCALTAASMTPIPQEKGVSASAALLAATKICAQGKCAAVVEALSSSSPTNGIRLAVEGGSIAVAAPIRYHGVEADTTTTAVELFRLVCDARSGSFVSIFPRSADLLRQLACNQPSEALRLRMASLPSHRRKAMGTQSSGRVVKDAFDALIRAMNSLGQKTGAGGPWLDLDQQSAQLRKQSIQASAADVHATLIKCCAMAALYGLVPMSFAIGAGLEALADM